MIDRITPPSAKMPSNILVPKAELRLLSNGIKVFIINKGEVDVCRIDFLFDAGSNFQEKMLVANGTLNLMTEGTSRFSSGQIADHLDFHGSYINKSVYNDFSRLTVHSVNRFLPQTLEMVEEIIKNPSFPQHEVDIWSSTGKQELKVTLNRTSALAQRGFLSSLFGNHHPYGRFANPSDYDLLSSSDFSSFHSKYYNSSGCTIFISGCISEHHISLIEKHFGESQWGSNSSLIAIPSLGKAKYEPLVYIEKENAVQTSLRIGRLLFPRSHPEFAEMVVVTTLLGGYFGSRLMKNLREDKGFTYGIHASIVPFVQSGVFQIGTDVGAIHTQDAINEILLEIERLGNVPVSESELELAKGSLMGQFLRSFNGQFSIAESIIWLYYFNNLNYEYYDKTIRTIQTITPERVMEQSKKWLNSNELTVCVAGSVKPS
jgi:predicted Zn-dependent peptidase